MPGAGLAPATSGDRTIRGANAAGVRPGELLLLYPSQWPADARRMRRGHEHVSRATHAEHLAIW